MYLHVFISCCIYDVEIPFRTLECAEALFHTGTVEQGAEKTLYTCENMMKRIVLEILDSCHCLNDRLF